MSLGSVDEIGWIIRDGQDPTIADRNAINENQFRIRIDPNDPNGPQFLFGVSGRDIKVPYDSLAVALNIHFLSWSRPEALTPRKIKSPIDFCNTGKGL